MNEKMEQIMNTGLEVLEIYANEILKKAKENVEDSDEIETNLRILNVIGSNMERLQRLHPEQPFSNFEDYIVCSHS